MEDEDGQEMEEVDEVDGEVTAVGTNQFTLMNERSGQSFTITVDSTTVFEDFDRSGCTASPADFTCVKTGQWLNVDLSANGMGSMLTNGADFKQHTNPLRTKRPTT